MRPLLFALAAAPLAASAATPTGAQVLQRCQRAYDSVRTLEQDVKGSIGASAGTAHISFSRPGKLRVSGKAIFSSKYDLLCDGRSTWVLNAGSWTKSASPEMGIATITGVSANAGTHVPALLMHTQWGSIAGLQHSATTVATQKYGGRDTYRVQAKSPYNMTIWVDAKTYFLVRTETQVMNQTIVVQFDPPKVNRPIPASRFVR